MGIVLPEWVARNERQRRVLEDSSSGVNQTRYWNPLLREIDARLQLVFIGAISDPIPGVVAFRWHVCRVNENGPDSYWALVGWDGEFREMGSDVLDRFRGMDLWNPDVRRDLEVSGRRKEESKERDRLNRKEARVDELTSNVNALIRPSVLVSDVPWTNRAAGKRGAKR